MRWSWIFLALLVSCDLKPPYERPEVALYTSWRVDELPSDTFDTTAFWKTFEDPTLDTLVDKTLAHNQNLQVAIGRVQEYFAKYGVAKSSLFPQLQLDAGATREKVSTDLISQVPIPKNTFDVYALLLNVSYQLDFWGELRNQSEAAYHNYLSQVENRRTVVLTLVQAITKAYLELKQYQTQRLIAEETLATRQVSYDLALIRFDLGLTSQMQVDQALSLKQSAVVTVENLTLLIALQEDLISFLIGEPSCAICGGGNLAGLSLPPKIPADIPCDLLVQRPDIVAKEEALKAANANIGVARALFFPNFTFNGGIDTESSFFNHLFSGPASTWNYGLGIVQEVFTGGKLTSNLKVTKAVKSQLLHEYHSVVLKAVQEVNDALISHKTALDLVASQQQRVDTLADYARLSNLRYTEGLVDYLNVLDAERELFEAQLDLTRFQAQCFTSLIDVYAALGGDWVQAADRQALGFFP